MCKKTTEIGSSLLKLFEMKVVRIFWDTLYSRYVRKESPVNIRELVGHVLIARSYTSLMWLTLSRMKFCSVLWKQTPATSVVLVTRKH